jgi:hypothetical protein
MTNYGAFWASASANVLYLSTPADVLYLPTPADVAKW